MSTAELKLDLINQITSITDKVKPVSYTHLDVYKRQLTSMVSSYLNKKVKPHIAMTGEITLRGKVLPVGGIKEKLLAAVRAEIKEVILCHENRKDVLEINQNYLKNLKVHYVKTMNEVVAVSYTHLDVYKRQIYKYLKSVCENTQF